MKMKRLLVVFLAGAMMILMAACGSSGGSDASISAGVEATATEDASADEQKSEQADADFQQTLVDNENVYVAITGIKHDGLWGYTWKLSIENRTDDTNLMVAMENVSVNGVMADPFFATEVAPGKTANSEVSWSDEEFESNDIEEVTAVEFELRIYDSDNWEVDAIVDEMMTVYPMGEESAQTVERESADTDIVLFDNDECSMILKSVDPDNLWGYTLKAYLVNKTDMDLMFSVNDASVNDIMCDPFWATTVAAGKTSNVEIYWMEETFEENGITDVVTIDLPITVYDEDDMFGDYLVDETFTINPTQLPVE